MIPLYALSAATGQVLTLDDQAVTDDLGTPFQAPIVSVGFEAGAWSSLRRVVQQVHLGGTATLSAAVQSDGTLGPAQTVSVSAATQGAQVPVTIPLDAHGTRHQLVLTVIGHAGSVELGAWSRHLIPRRTVRGS